MNPYLGHKKQLYGFDHLCRVGGKGDGMALLRLYNASGLELELSPDRCLDIPVLRCKGVNFSYLSPCGYVAPQYYEKRDSQWLRSFTAGFLTTCGLENVGSPCEDQGEVLSLHGSIANTPAEELQYFEEGDELVVRATVPDEVIFGRKLRLYRELRVKIHENRFTLTDVIENSGDRVEPFEILYHMNLGYPLLDEDSKLRINSTVVSPRDAHAAQHLDSWAKMEPPTPGYQERCYYHQFTEPACVELEQPKLGMGLRICFDPKVLDGFVEWKMMGYRDYVLGLECGNCYADGRAITREKGMLKFLAPGETARYSYEVELC